MQLHVEGLEFWSFWYIDKIQTKKFDFLNYNSDLFKLKGCSKYPFSLLLIIGTLRNFHRIYKFKYKQKLENWYFHHFLQNKGYRIALDTAGLIRSVALNSARIVQLL